MKCALRKTACYLQQDFSVFFFSVSQVCFLSASQVCFFSASFFALSQHVHTGGLLLEFVVHECTK